MHLHFRVLGVGRLWRWLQGRQGWGTWARWSDLKRGLQTRRSQCMLGYTTRTWPCSKARHQLPFPQEIEDTKERLWHEIGGCNTNVYFILGVVDVFAWAYVCKWLWEQREQDASEFLLRRWSCLTVGRWIWKQYTWVGFATDSRSSCFFPPLFFFYLPFKLFSWDRYPLSSKIFQPFKINILIGAWNIFNIYPNRRWFFCKIHHLIAKKCVIYQPILCFVH